MPLAFVALAFDVGLVPLTGWLLLRCWSLCGFLVYIGNRLTTGFLVGWLILYWSVAF